MFQKMSLRKPDMATPVQKERRRKALRPYGCLAMGLMFLAGMSLPAVAQMPSQGHKLSTHRVSFEIETQNQFNESTQLEAAIAADINQLIATEIQSWSPAQKAAFQTLKGMELKDSELESLAALSPSEMQTKMRTSKKIAKLSATGISSEEALKLAPTLLLSRYLLNIGRAAVWGGVVSAIRAADFDYRALSTALTSGNTRQFMSLLGQGMSGQNNFLSLMGSAANFACGSATLDFTPRLCDRFSTGIQKIFTRVNRSSTQAQRPRPTTTQSRRPRVRFPRPSTQSAK